MRNQHRESLHQIPGGGQFPRPVRHGRKCLGVGKRLVWRAVLRDFSKRRPHRPDFGSIRVARGSFDNTAGPLERLPKLWKDTFSAENLGFRCVISRSEPENCDGVDNDIDGLTDEDFGILEWDGTIAGVGQSCGTGACAGGRVVCNEDGGGSTCDTKYLMAAEVTNGIDDDCNG